MTSLPESIGNIASLIGLQLQYTAIQSLPDSIGRLSNLEALGIYSSANEMPWDYSKYQYPDYYQDEATEKRSPFTGLPDTASQLVSLKFLNVSNSELISLPDYLGNLPNLERIELMDCNIKTIPPSIQRLVDNGELTLIKNERESFSDRHFFGRRKPRRTTAAAVAIS